MAKYTGIPLKMLVSGAIVFGMLILALALILLSYSGNRRMMIQAAQENAVQMSRNINIRLENFTQPILANLRLLELDPLMNAGDFEQRLERLRVLARMLVTNPVTSALYAGYEDGDFFLLRKVPAGFDGAPRNAFFLLQGIDRDAHGRITAARWQFYDASLHLLSDQERPDYRYDPRSRPWFSQALASSEAVMTAPYLFYTTHEIGTTISLYNAATQAVLGVDASIADLSSLLDSLRPHPSTALALVNADQSLIGYPSPGEMIRTGTDGEMRIARVEELGIPALTTLAGAPQDNGRLRRIPTADGDWFGVSIRVGKDRIEPLQLLFAVPARTLLATARIQRDHQLLWSALIILVLVLLGLHLGRRISRPLQLLAHSVLAMGRFDFSQRIEIRSHIREVNQLAALIDRMAIAIDNFQKIARTLAREQDMDQMLGEITRHLVNVTGAQTGLIYLLDTERNVLIRVSGSWETAPGEIAPADLGLKDFTTDVLMQAVQQSLAGADTPLLATPLRDRSQRLRGLLVLIRPATPLSEDDTGEQRADGVTAHHFLNDYRHFVEEVSGSAATALETRQQVLDQQAMIEAIIRLLADAIDAKSPCTSGHCERVPQLAQMLVDAASQSDTPPFAGFRMSEAERHEFRIAAWLHDCGKITSQEYVVDKATKLETLYNRIHEIRTRFEVLWRDCEIDYWKAVAAGADQESQARRREARQAQLREDFAFLAQCNIGSEFLSGEALQRLQKIARQSWERHFDKRLGLSREESQRLGDAPDPLPARENLLADRPEHCIPWGERRPPVEKGDPANRWGFDMDLPEHARNLGELYNLGIQRGTLSAEERFLINDHIVQTIRMLSSLPLPEDMKRIPDIAGNHHERMDGQGYPRRLAATELSIPERIMALADVFEALTAGDRPYKDAKPLSVALQILASMVAEGHIDGALFRLFLVSGIPQEYARRFLDPRQIDATDIPALLERAGLAATTHAPPRPH